jgi:hypothetical protein
MTSIRQSLMATVDGDGCAHDCCMLRTKCLMLSSNDPCRLKTSMLLASIMGDKQKDIRSWLTPEKGSANATPSRRRRVMTTTDSEEERSLQARPAVAAQDHIHNVDEVNGAQQLVSAKGSGHDEPAAQATVHVISASSDSDDSMVLLLSSRGAAQQAPIMATNKRGSVTQSKVNTRSRSAGKKKRSRNPVQKFCGEAEETSSTGSATSNCDESEPDAQMLYRQAITGVRNAHNARSQRRIATLNCPVCTKFAEYLQHFLWQ